MEMHSFDDIKLVLGYARYTSRDIFEIKFIPPANEVCEGYVFTRVCQSFCSWLGGGIPSCIAGGIPACLAGLQGEGSIPACLAGLQAHTQGGVEGSGQRGISRPLPGGGGSRPTPGRSPGPHPGGISQHG